MLIEDPTAASQEPGATEDSATIVENPVGSAMMLGDDLGGFRLQKRGMGLEVAAARYKTPYMNCQEDPAQSVMEGVNIVWFHLAWYRETRD